MKHDKQNTNPSISPDPSANDCTPDGLVAAQANYNMVALHWCSGHEKTPDPVYYRDTKSGLHGWMCPLCRGIVQTG